MTGSDRKIESNNASMALSIGNNYCIILYWIYKSYSIINSPK